MRGLLMVSACLALLISVVSSSATADNMSSSMSKSGATSNAWLIGSWTCIAKMSAMGKTPAHTETDAMTFQRVLNGTWLQQTYTGTGFSAQSFWRWDKATGSLVSVGVDSFGGYGTEATKGSMTVGKLVTVSGTMTYAGHPTAVVDLLTKLSDTKMNHVGKMQQNGKWRQTDNTTCTKNT